ncbi:MAG: SPOR domain-containing protein [Pseudomonadota bacterium]
MSRDYKARSNVPKRKAKAKGSTLVGIFIGLVLGVVIAFAVVWYLNKTPVPFLDKSVRPAEKSGEAARPGQPLALPGKPGDKAPERGDKPRFEFYKILPGEGEAAPAPAPAEQKPEQPAKAAAETFYLQAGAFQNPADADNLKAKLALMGLEAAVQQVSMQDKGTWHRVRLGPYRSQEELAPVRNQLQQNGIQASVVKVKDGAANH